MPVAVTGLPWVVPRAVGVAPIDVVQWLAAEPRVSEVVVAARESLGGGVLRRVPCTVEAILAVLVLRRVPCTVEAILAVLVGLESGFESAVSAEGTSVDEAQGLVGLRLVAEGVLSVAVATARPARPVLEGGLLPLGSSLLHDVAWTSDEPGMGALPGIALATRTGLGDGLLHGATRASDALCVVGAGVASIRRVAPWSGVA